MSKRIFVTAIATAVLLLVFGSIAFASDGASATSMSENGQTTTQIISLNPIGDASGSGVAKIRVHETKNGLYHVKVVIKVKGIVLPEGKILQGWLVDDNGPDRRLGTFTVDEKGQGKLVYEDTLANFDAYELVGVSREPINDTDPASETELLSGQIQR